MKPKAEVKISREDIEIAMRSFTGPIPRLPDQVSEVDLTTHYYRFEGRTLPGKVPVKISQKRVGIYRKPRKKRDRGSHKRRNGRR